MRQKESKKKLESGNKIFGIIKQLNYNEAPLVCSNGAFFFLSSGFGNRVSFIDIGF